MEILLDSTDLKPKYQFRRNGQKPIQPTEVAYEHLNERAQAVVKIAGDAKFQYWVGECDGPHSIYWLRDTKITAPK